MYTVYVQQIMNEWDLEMQQITYEEFQIRTESHHTIFINFLLWFSMLSCALAKATVWPQCEDTPVQLALPLFIHWHHEYLPSSLGAFWSRIAYLRDVVPIVRCCVGQRYLKYSWYS